MTPDLLRNTLKLATAVFFTAALAVWSERIAYVWYPLMAVVIVIDDNDDHTSQAVVGRILGTVMGGLISGMVHLLLGGWIGVLVSLLVMIPVLQLLGWQSAMSTAGLTAVMFLMLPSHAVLGWQYVFNRSLDTVIGCVVALIVGRLFWPRGAYDVLRLTDARLRGRLHSQLELYQRWLLSGGPRPQPLDPAPLTSDLQQLEQLVARERRGPRHRILQCSGWEARLRLWQLTHGHWIAWERLLADLPERVGLDSDPLRQSVLALSGQLTGRPGPPPRRDPRQWQQLAVEQRLPLLPLLALAEELRPLHSCLGGLNRVAPS